MKPGYLMIDCGGLNLNTDSTQTISGLFNRCIEAISIDKPVFAYNCKWGDKDVTPIQTFLIDWGNYIIATASTLQVIVNKNDEVTIGNLIGG